MTSTRDQVIEKRADIYAFFLDRLSMSGGGGPSE
jgi:hypothetical protein